MTYRNQMTEELGYTRQEGYELWDIFAEQMVRRFGPTHEEEAVRQMIEVRYKGDIGQFMLEIDNWNVKVKVTGVVLRKLIEYQIPEEAVRRLSMIDPILDEWEWLEAVRTAEWKEEDFQEGRKFKNTDSSGSGSSGKRKQNEPTTAAVIKQPKYTAKEKRVYQAKKKEERAEKKPAAPRQERMYRVWANAHTSIDQKEIDERKAKKQCTRCTLTNHGWKHCKKEIWISTIQRRPFKLPVGCLKPPRPQKQRVAAVADDSRGESL